MKLDLSCPVELRGYALSYTDGAVTADVRLYNLTARRVAAFEGVAKWRSSVAERSIATPFVIDRLRAGGESTFNVSLDNTLLPDADCLEILFTAVRFENGLDEWRAGDGPYAELKPLPAISSDELVLLRAAAGDDAVCFPTCENALWRCVCGRINQDESCVRCHRTQEEALRHTPDTVRRHTPIAETDLTEMPEHFLHRQARRFRRTLAIALAVLALAGFFAVRFLPEKNPVPALRAEASVEAEK